jgi:hypothetical protein
MGTAASAARAELSVGVGYPYAAVRYDFIPQASAEAKYAFSDGVNVFAGRGYWNFLRTRSLNAFAGLEAGGLNFNTLGIAGTGVEYGAFVGGRYEVLPKLEVSLDLGPSMINLSSQGTDNSGVEWIVTAGVYWRVF